MLRLGIIFLVTGVIALGHWFLASKRRLPGRWELIVAIVLILAGIPLLVVGAS
jgi:uncharacterized membrane protein HdeD (DUF308 family)